MSLIKQLWLATAVLMLVAFGGSFLVSSLSAKAYLEEQLLIKNLENATALASTLSQMPKDKVTLELLISSQFDAGHYESIRLADPYGNLIVERVNEVPGNGAPGWFMALFPVDAAPGVAQVQDGWKQYGTLTLSSHNRFAYRELWSSTLNLLAWFLAAALMAGIVGTVLLRRILRPLGAVVDQAEAIGARRFITTPEPETPEFRAVVRSVNKLARRVRQMLDDESMRLEQLRREAHHDAVTGLLNRGHFMARMQAVLGREDESSQGVLVLVRLLDLSELNRTQGWSVTDALIRRCAQAMKEIDSNGVEWVCGRLNGSDYAVLAPGVDDAEAIARTISEALELVARELGLADACRLPAAGTLYGPGEQLSEVLSRVDAALLAAVAEGGNAVQVAAADARKPTLKVRANLQNWRLQLEDALNQKHAMLHGYPVVDAGGKLLHEECVARLRVEDAPDWIPAGEFMPWMARLGLSSQLDEIVIDLALDKLRQGSDDICINVSSQGMNDAVLMHRLADRLSKVPELSRRLWLEVPEHGVFQNLEHYRILCSLLKPVGCRLGIEHVGHQVSRIGLLHDLGIDYIKVDASFVRDIDNNQANQVFLRGLAMIAHSIGLNAIGEGVHSYDEFRALVELGFDGATGPAVTRRQGSGGHHINGVTAVGARRRAS